MPIQALAPRHCERCQAANSFMLVDELWLECRNCGHRIPAEDDAPPEPSPAPPRHTRYRVSYGLIHPDPDEIDPRTRSLYESGLSSIERGLPDEARRHLLRALELVDSFTDAHLWLARLADDEATQREHYGAVVAIVPNHQEALRELMRLNGELSAAEAERSGDAWHNPFRKADTPAQAEAQASDCPVCGAAFTTDAEGHPVCAACAYRPPLPSSGAYGLESLSMALLKRRGAARRWLIGERILVCDACGAERLLQADALTARCPYCHAGQVLVRDAAHSFVQPDGLLPFRIDEGEARAALERALTGLGERFVGLFTNNKIARYDLSSAYLPCWFFDVQVEVIRTVIEKNTSLYNERTMSAAHRTERQRDVLFDMLAFATTNPPTELLARLPAYDLEAVVPYDPVRLAQHEAQLYSVDFDAASLAIRPDVAERVRQRYGHSPQGDQEVRVSSMVLGMQFRLLLLPVWVATLIEVDGDVRLGLVQGQNGGLALGRLGRKVG